MLDPSPAQPWRVLVPCTGGSLLRDFRTGQESHGSEGAAAPLWTLSSDRLARVSEGRLDVSGPGGLVWSTELPEGFAPKCLLATERAIFAGGKGEAKLLGWWLDDGGRIHVESPGLLKRYRKSVDDLFIWEESLIAVDNLIHPKYLLSYREEGGSLVFQGKRELARNGPHEHILRGARAGGRLGVLSATVHRAGGSHYASIYSWPGLELQHSLIWHSMGPAGEPRRLTDIAFTGSSLLLGTDIGAGRLPLESPREGDLELFGPKKAVRSIHPLPDGRSVVLYAGPDWEWQELPAP